MTYHRNFDPEKTRRAVSKIQTVPAETHIQKKCFKTKLCTFFLEGKCTKGDSCLFAHADQELHDKPDFKKTRLCVAFQQGHCPKISDECDFAHGPSDFRKEVDMPPSRKARMNYDMKQQNGKGFSGKDSYRSLLSNSGTSIRARGPLIDVLCTPDAPTPRQMADSSIQSQPLPQLCSSGSSHMRGRSRSNTAHHTSPHLISSSQFSPDPMVYDPLASSGMISPPMNYMAMMSPHLGLSVTASPNVIMNTPEKMFPLGGSMSHQHHPGMTTPNGLNVMNHMVGYQRSSDLSNLFENINPFVSEPSAYTSANRPGDFLMSPNPQIHLSGQNNHGMIIEFGGGLQKFDNKYGSNSYVQQQPLPVYGLDEEGHRP